MNEQSSQSNECPLCLNDARVGDHGVGRCYVARPDTPPRCVCDTCGRKSWDMTEVGRVCAMPPPDGTPCAGVMRPVQHRALRPPLSK